MAVLPTALYLVGRLTQYLVSGRPVFTPDTPSYRVAGSGWFDFDLVSATGHTLRPWTITLPYALAPGDIWRVALQVVVATAAWVALLVAVTGLPIGPWRRCLLGLAISTVGLAVGTAVWDWTLLSESLLTSACVLFVAGAVRTTSHARSAHGPVVMTVAGVLVAITRLTYVPLLVGAVVIAAAAARPARQKGRSGTGSVQSPTLRRRWLIVSIALASLVAVAYAAWYNDQIDYWWGRHESLAVERDASLGGRAAATRFRGRTLQQYGVLLESPEGPVVIGLLRRSAPACIVAPDPLPDDIFRWWHLRIGDCPDGVRWVSDEFQRWFVLRLAEHPRFAYRYFSAALSDIGVGRRDGGQVRQVLPTPVSRLWFQPRGSDVDPVRVLVLLALLLVSMNAVRTLRGHQRDNHWYMTTVGLVLLAAGIAAVLATALGSATDLSRVGAPATTVVRLAGLLLVATNLPPAAGLRCDGRWLSSRRRHRPSPARAAPPCR